MLAARLMLLLLLVACADEPAPSVGPAPTPLALDGPLPGADRQTVWPSPLDYDVMARADELPLVGFRCRREERGKPFWGTVTASFTPGPRPGDGTFEVRLQQACEATLVFEVVHGKMQDEYGTAVRCRRSPYSAMAVSCGPYLQTILGIEVRGNTTGRTVRFQVPKRPWRLPQREACSLHFTLYDDAGAPTDMPDELPVFDLADCALVEVAAR